jgi:hypothetical protein
LTVLPTPSHDVQTIRLTGDWGNAGQSVLSVRFAVVSDQSIPSN